MPSFEADSGGNRREVRKYMRMKRFIVIALCAALSLGVSAAASPAEAERQQVDIAEEGAYGQSLDAAGAPEAQAEAPIPSSAEEPAASQALPGNTLLLQISNFYAVKNGERIRLTSGFGAPLTPYYDNGFSMLPLRAIAETFGYNVTWEESTQSVTVSGEDLSAVFTVGSAGAAVSGQITELDAEAMIRGDAVYVPARNLCGLLGCYIHYFDCDSGEFLLISDYPVSAGDLSGGSNEDYSPIAPDNALLSFKMLGDALLGPSRSLYAAHTLTLMRGSTYALLDGEPAVITEQNASMVAPLRAADGSAYIPLAYCAGCFGVEAEAAAALAALEFDGVAYTSLQAFAEVAGLSCYETDDDVWVLSEFDFTEFDNLTGYAAADAARLRELPVIRGYIALTYDDGPSGAVTERLLDGLFARNVHVTFFLCGNRIKQNHAYMSRYVAEGHEIGNHSVSHPDMTKLSADAIGAELDKTNELIAQYTGVTPVIFRAPYGAYNQKVLSELLSRSLPCILWSDSFEDWNYRDSRPIINAILPHAGDGTIILLHDYYDASADAGLAVIDVLQAEGYKFVTVSDLALIKGRALEPGHVYCSIR